MKLPDQQSSLIATTGEFSLRANILWENCCGYWLLNEQLQCIRSSADFFSFSLDEDRLLAYLDDVTRTLPQAPHVVHVDLARNGSVTLSTEISSEDRKPVTAALAKKAVDSDNVFLYHQTSCPVYADAEPDIADVDEIIFWNDRGEITETTTANIIVEIDGVLITPPVSCGLHPGPYRAKLLSDNRFIERPIRIEELQSCTNIYLINSLVGWREVEYRVKPSAAVQSL